MWVWAYSRYPASFLSIVKKKIAKRKLLIMFTTSIKAVPKKTSGTMPLVTVVRAVAISKRFLRFVAVPFVEFVPLVLFVPFNNRDALAFSSLSS